MFRLLLLPAALWVMIPQGFCICHLPERLLAALSGESVALPADAPDLDQEDEHTPSCPAHKAPYLASPFAAFHHDGLGAAALLPPAPAAAGPEVLPVANGPSPPLDPSDQPLYLILRALRN